MATAKGPRVQSWCDRDEQEGTLNNEPSMTKQSFTKEADIDYILKKYAETGVVQHGAVGSAMYGDFQDVPAYQEALDAVMRAQEGFDSLPAQVRTRFGNDPAKLLEFVSDDKNYEEAIKLGLVTKKPDPEPQPKPQEPAPAGAKN